MITRLSLAILGLAILAIAGCGDSYNDPLSAPKTQIDPGRYGVVMEDPLESKPAVGSQKKTEKAKPAKTEEGGQKPPAPAEAKPEKPAAPPKETVREEVKVGVGEKGRGYGGGIITTPVQVYFHARERITFDQLKHDLDLYKALNGSGPKTTEEYMAKIVKANGRDLPELPQGYKYIYDAEKEQLMVEHPK